MNVPDKKVLCQEILVRIIAVRKIKENRSLLDLVTIRITMDIILQDELLRH